MIAPRVRGGFLGWLGTFLGAVALLLQRARLKSEKGGLRGRIVTSCLMTYGSSSAHKQDCDRVAWNYLAGM